MGESNQHFLIDQTLLKTIKEIITVSRNQIAVKINHALIVTYWKIGQEIINTENNNSIEQISSRQLIITLSKQLTTELGKGFSRSNLFNMRKFYLTYPNVQTLSGQLSWSHISELLTIENKEKRSFYEQETIHSKWSVRELKRQINSSLYERLLLSDGKINKKKLMSLSKNGHEIKEPQDIIKNPYVFEFLGIPEKKPIFEKDLEKKLIKYIEEFLLELGKGFMFVGSQQRITLNNTHYFVDMVFYNKILKCYILIELKTTKLNITDAGQLNTYLNYYKTEVNDESDNAPIGIILCTEKDEITAEYILSGLENNVFATKYTYVLPNKENLIQAVENRLKNE